MSIRLYSLFGGGEGQEKGGVTVQVLDLERHDVSSAARLL